jgi:hypothetical protein
MFDYAMAEDKTELNESMYAYYFSCQLPTDLKIIRTLEEQVHYQTTFDSFVKSPACPELKTIVADFRDEGFGDNWVTFKDKVCMALFHSIIFFE